VWLGKRVEAPLEISDLVVLHRQLLFDFGGEFLGLLSVGLVEGIVKYEPLQDENYGLTFIGVSLRDIAFQESSS